MAKTKKVVIDTDFGTDVDDAIAIALAVASPEIEVQAFTVMGRQSIYRKKMLEDFLSYLGNDCAIPPVYRVELRGLSQPFAIRRDISGLAGPASPESIFVMCDSAKHSARDFNTVKDDG